MTEAGRTDLPAQPPETASLLECVAGASDFDELARNLVNGLIRHFDADRGSLFVIDRSQMCLRSVVAIGVGHTLVVPLRIGLVGASILMRECLRAANAYEHPFFNPEIDTALGFQTRSLLVAPICGTHGAVLGCVEMINKLDGDFTDQDQAKAMAAAARFARWIETDSLYPAGIEAEAVATRRSIGCERASIFGVDRGNSHLKALFADGDDGRMLGLNVKLGIAGTVAISARSVLLADSWDDRRFDRSVDARTGYRTRSMLCVPVLSERGRTIGVLQLINRRDGPFLPEHQAALEAVAVDIAPRLIAAASPELGWQHGAQA